MADIIKPSLFRRAVQAARYTIAGIQPDTWNSPLQPHEPITPVVQGRQFDFVVGYNRNYVPRGKERVSFRELRNMAQMCEGLRLVIETRKDQLCALKWTIKPKQKDKERSANKKEDPRVTALLKFFSKPDQVHDWDSWLRMLLEELFVPDAVTIWKRPNRGGGIYAYELLDGTTIFPLIDEGGRRPLAPDPAYQQILKGVPKADYTSDELVYAPRNLRVWSPYGYGPTEQVIMSARMDIERGNLQLAYFTEGNAPDTVATMGDKVTPEAIKAFEDRLLAYLKGNAATRREVVFFPFGTEFKQIKPPPLKDEFDEWLMRKICFAFSISPTAFVKQNNRATADSEKERSEEEGLLPLMLWVKRLIDNMILADFGYDDLEFHWDIDESLDPEVAANISKTLVTSGLKTINQDRLERGDDPVEGGDVPMVLTASGYLPIDNWKQAQADKQKAMELAAKNPPPGQNGDQNAPPKDDKAPKNDDEGAAVKSAYTRLGKAVRPSAIPFPRKSTKAAAAVLADKLTPILKKCGESVADQFVAAQEAQKMAKDGVGAGVYSGGDWASDFATYVSLDDLDEVITVAPNELEQVMKETGQMALAQVGKGTDADLVNQVDQRAVNYAEERAAELVGKRVLSDGSIIENPNAVWRIDEATREAIRRIIVDGLADNIGIQGIAKKIKEDQAFSKERSQLIANTEVARANGLASLESYRAARQAGVNVLKEWKCDAEACPVCKTNEDFGPIDLDEDFPSGDLAVPAHPRCECAINPVLPDDA